MIQRYHRAAVALGEKFRGNKRSYKMLKEIERVRCLFVNCEDTTPQALYVNRLPFYILSGSKVKKGDQQHVC